MRAERGDVGAGDPLRQVRAARPSFAARAEPTVGEIERDATERLAVEHTVGGFAQHRGLGLLTVMPGPGRRGAARHSTCRPRRRRRGPDEPLPGLGDFLGGDRALDARDEQPVAGDRVDLVGHRDEMAQPRGVGDADELLEFRRLAA